MHAVNHWLHAVGKEAWKGHEAAVCIAVRVPTVVQDYPAIPKVEHGDTRAGILGNEGVGHRAYLELSAVIFAARSYAAPRLPAGIGWWISGEFEGVW